MRHARARARHIIHGLPFHPGGVGWLARFAECSRPEKTANIWASLPYVRELLARCSFVQKPAFYHAFARCFCVGLARLACLFFAFSGSKTGDVGDAGGLAAQPVGGMLGMPGVLMLGLVISCSRSLRRGPCSEWPSRH